MKFIYQEAFSRNIGLITEQEQERLRQFTIAIPGMGGVGSTHLLSLVRQGFEKFKIADIDTYELANFNRQAGANLDTIGKHKAKVMKEEALKINPNCQIETFTDGVNEENIESFLNGVDLAVDALDFFATDARRMYFNHAHNKKIPIITAGPIGFGTAFLIFMPEGPSFDEYFAINDRTGEQEKYIKFAVGLAPGLLQRTYMKGVNLKEKKGPSSIGAVDLCAGIVAVHALKILLKKGKVYAVPYYHQFDAMRNRYVMKKVRWGNKNPIQRIKIAFARKLLK